MNFPSRYISLLAPLALSCVLSISSQAQNTTQTVPSGVRMTLEPLRPTFFLGENVLAHFGVENTGTKPFTISTGGDYRGAARAMRFVVTAQDAEGHAVSDPYPATTNFGGLGGSQTLKPGEKWFQTLSLIRYCRFDAPGKYLVRTKHDLGWRSTPDHPLPVAQAHIELKMPSPDQARNILEEMELAPQNQGVLTGQKNLQPQVDFSAMRYPVYLPFLLERIDAGKLDFLPSVAGIETPEATRALVARLEGKTEIAGAVARVLTQRIPAPPPTFSWPQAEEARKQRDQRVKASWRTEFAAPTRAYALQALQSSDRETLRTASTLLNGVGTAQDLPLVMSALEKRIGMTVQTPRWQEEGDAVPDNQDGWQLQDDCLMLMQCGAALVARGAVLPPETVGGTSASAIALRVGTKRGYQVPGRAPFQARWLRHPVPFIRQLGLESLAPPSYPPPAPQAVLSPEVRAVLPELLRDPDISVRAAACDLAGKSRDKTLLPDVLKVLASSRNRWLIDYANGAANALGGRYEAWTVWANRLDEKKMLRPAIEALSHVVGGASGYGWNSSDSDAEVGARLKPKWQKFLLVNRARLQKGELFSQSEAAWPKDLFPKEFQLSG